MIPLTISSIVQAILILVLALRIEKLRRRVMIAESRANEALIRCVGIVRVFFNARYGKDDDAYPGDEVARILRVAGTGVGRWDGSTDSGGEGDPGVIDHG